MSCLANRTLDDDPRVRRTPSVGWLSKSMGGERAEMVVLGRGRAGQLGSGLSSGLEIIPEGARKGNM